MSELHLACKRDFIHGLCIYVSEEFFLAFYTCRRYCGSSRPFNPCSLPFSICAGSVLWTGSCSCSCSWFLFSIVLENKAFTLLAFTWLCALFLCLPSLWRKLPTAWIYRSRGGLSIKTVVLDGAYYGLRCYFKSNTPSFFKSYRLSLLLAFIRCKLLRPLPIKFLVPR